MSNSGTLIVGGGLAGLFCALKLAPRPVTVLLSGALGAGASSAWAQGGVAAAIGEGDTPESHTADTLIAGAGIVDEAITLAMTREASARVADLLSYGVPFDRDLAGKLVASREAAHSQRRIIRVQGDRAGYAIMEALVAAVRKTPSIRILEHWTAEKLETREGRVTGVFARDEAGRAWSLPAAHVVLATGGIGHLYHVTTNPPEARGIGLAMAAQAGAVIADAEFVQFHPTALDIGRDPAPLATEALRGDGALLIDRKGHRFMPAIHPDAELAPRDIVARAVFAEIKAGRGAFLDARAAIGAEFPERFPTVFAACQSVGINPAIQPMPIAPAAHYHMGGVWTDAHGRTSLGGLWAAGEVASTGVHGANRLASNSLLEAVVFAARAAEDIAAKTVPGSADVAPERVKQDDDHAPRDMDAELKLRQTMSADVGVVRDAHGLDDALATILRIRRDASNANLRNMTDAAVLVAASAAARHESRGGHFRSDFPHAIPALARRSRITLDEAMTIAHAQAGAFHA